MKLTYKILWIDDRIDEAPFQEMVEKLKAYLTEEEFFEVTLRDVDTSENFDENLSEEFDLIITDFNLDDINGDEVIARIRGKHIMTEVFFYSANSQLKPNSTLLNNSRVTFYQMADANGYNELYIEIKRLIELTIHKFHHIISMRGMVMAETSEIDVLMEDILRHILAGNSDEKNTAKGIIKGKFIESSKSSLEKFATIDEINELALLLRKVGSEHRWRGVKRNCPNNLKQPYKEVLDKYKTDVIDERNILAHAKYYKVEGGEYLENFNPEGEPYKFDTEKCRDLRKKLNIYKRVLIDFQSRLKADGNVV